MSSTKRRSDEADALHADGRQLKKVKAELTKSKYVPENLQKFKPGSIIRVKMVNFVTYSEIEYYLGPCLNMIIGPNGSGKSTFVSALCLGLGGKPDLLGRARHLSDYIKVGCDSAYIEIELKGFSGKGNVTIGRSFSKSNRDGASTTWSINGSTVTQTKMFETIDKFGMQIDNLCQFLPQDKVASFAQVSPQQKLLDTERAVGSRGMVEQHENLIKLSQEITLLGESTRSYHAELESLNNLYEENQRALRSYRDFERNQVKVEKLKKMIQVARFTEYKDKRGELANQLKDIETTIKRSKEGSQKALDRKAHASMSYDLAKKEDVEIGLSIKTAENELAMENTKLEAAYNETKRDKDGLNQSFAREKDGKESIARQRSKIEQLEKTLAEEKAKDPDGSILKSLKEKRREAQLNREKIDNNLQLVSREISHVGTRKSEMDASIQSLKETLRREESSSARRLNSLREYNSDTYSAVIWLQENRAKFKKKIMLPPYLLLDVKEKASWTVLVNVINSVTLLAFTCQSRDDYKAFSKVCYEEMGWHSVKIRDFSNAEPYSKPYFESEELREIGFDGYVVDLINLKPSDEPVLTMLKYESSIHLIPYTKRQLTQTQIDRLDSITDPRGNIVFRRYINGELNCFSEKSRYGKRTVTTSIERMTNRPPHAYLSKDSIDQQKIINTRGEISTLEEERGEVQQRLSSLGDQQSELNQAKDNAEADYKKSKNEVEMFQKRIDTLEISLRNSRESEETLKDKLTAELESRDGLQKKLKKSVEALALLLVNASKPAARLVALEKQKLETQLKIKVFGHEQRMFSVLTNDFDTELKRRKSELLKEIEEVEAKIKEQKKIVGHYPKDFIKECERLNNGRSVVDVQRDLNAAEADLDLVGGDVNHINKRRLQEQEVSLKQRIDSINQSLTDSTSKRDNGQQEIQLIRSDWEPRLDSIVERVSQAFSEYFAAIGCKGLVKIGKDGSNFKDWTLDIMVSFRPNDAPLQVLSANRQSGGERAVSTVLYLMALQGLATAPFRVVDEINQGMDPKNERMVHNRMVDVACQENASQYFLITPKLLPDLRYHPNMKVCCIYSGAAVEDKAAESKISARKVISLIKELKQRLDDGDEDEDLDQNY